MHKMARSATNYGPTSKQLDAVATVLLRKLKVAEYEDPDGWYEDGYRDARKGRPCSYGQCSIAVNQEAYVRGYDDGARDFFKEATDATRMD